MAGTWTVEMEEATDIDEIVLGVEVKESVPVW